jgi:hypothetical protein
MCSWLTQWDLSARAVVPPVRKTRHVPFVVKRPALKKQPDRDPERE